MSSPSTEQQLVTVFGWVFGIFFTFIGLVFTLLGSFEMYQGWRTQDWPSVPGRIISSEIESRDSRSRSSGGRSRTDTDYSVKIRYAYEVAGQSLEGTRIQYGYQSHDGRASARKEQSRYLPAKEVQVYYDPDNPSRSVLVKGAGTSWLAIGLGSLALVLGLFTMGYLAYRKRTRTG